jgi:DNA-binding transcriptional MerR regulator
MNQPNALLRIGQLARLTGKTVRALHLYEERGLLVPAQRTQGGFRQYNTENVDRIRYIERLQRLDFSLKDIQELVQEWDAGASPRASMEELANIYRVRLNKVRADLAELQTLQGELEQSLQFLSGCGDCTREAPDPKAACGQCARSERGAHLTLISGITGR